MRYAITLEQAKAMLSEPGYDGYGTHRLYGTYAEGSKYAGQIASPKTVIQLHEAMLDELDPDSLEVSVNDGSGMPPILRKGG